MSDLHVEVDDHVAIVEIRRPPNNFFDLALIVDLIERLTELEADTDVRCVVLCSDGKHFCAGANFQPVSESGPDRLAADAPHFYMTAAGLFDVSLPVVAAVQGGAIGGGLGLALVADFRVGSVESRFSANFARLGFHHGFGLTETLPLVVGHQHTLDLLLTGRRIDGVAAHRIGLVDDLVDGTDQIRPRAMERARELAASAPLATRSIKVTMRAPVARRVREAVERELGEQERLKLTADWAEGVRAQSERREPHFRGC